MYVLYPAIGNWIPGLAITFFIWHLEDCFEFLHLSFSDIKFCGTQIAWLDEVSSKFNDIHLVLPIGGDALRLLVLLIHPFIVVVNIISHS